MGDGAEVTREEFLSAVVALEFAGVCAKREFSDEVFAVLIFPRVFFEFEYAADAQATRLSSALDYFVAGLEFLEADFGIAFGVVVVVIVTGIVVHREAG